MEDVVEMYVYVCKYFTSKYVLGSTWYEVFR